MTAVLAPAPAVPLVAIDDVAVGPDGELVAHKAIVDDDPYLAGHYPGAPIYPGVFVVESVLQAARRFLPGGAWPGLVLSEIESVRFAAPLYPGDTLRMSLIFRREPAATPVSAEYSVLARCTRADDTLAARVSLRCKAFRPTDDPDGSVAAAPFAWVPPPRFAGVPPLLTAHGRGLPTARELLPHRPPILLVDAVLSAEASVRIVTRRTIDPAEPCFRDHRSARCAYPETLVLESFVQSGAALLLLGRRRSGETAGTPVFGSARGVRFHAPVFAGETLVHTVELDRLVGDNALLTGTTWVGGRLCLTVDSAVAGVHRLAGADVSRTHLGSR